MRHLMIPTILALLSAPALAATDVELGISGLKYSKTTTETSLDGGDVEDEENATLTHEPNLGIAVFTPQWAFHFGVDATSDSKSGTIGAGHSVAKNTYAGLLLDIEKTETTTTSKPDGGDKSKDESSVDGLAIGPYVEHRCKENGRLVSLVGALVQMSRTSEAESDAGATTTKTKEEFKMMLLMLSGTYYWQIMDRFWAGAGASYSMSLSGDYEVDSGSNSDDGSIKYTDLTVNLLDLIVEL